MSLDVRFVGWKCGRLTFNVEMTFIKKWMDLYSWLVFPPGSICFYFDYDCFFGQFICWECDQKLHVCTFLVENKVYIFSTKGLVIHLFSKHFWVFLSKNGKLLFVLKQFTYNFLDIFYHLINWLIPSIEFLHEYTSHWIRCHKFAGIYTVLSTQAFFVIFTVLYKHFNSL